MSKTILLADDSLTIQKVIELTFAETDFDVVATSSGDELIGKLAGISPDIVICDTIMPGRDGYDICQRIKSDPATLHIPVVLLTGTFEPFDRDRALAAGCSEIVTKPFEARRLVDAVVRLTSGDSTAAQAAKPDEPGSSEYSPEFAGAVAPPAYGEATVRLSASPVDEALEFAENEEGLDFTSTGFDEMVAAASQTPDDLSEVTPEHGLEYDLEIDDTHQTASPSPGMPIIENTMPIPTAEFSEDDDFDEIDADDEAGAFDTPAGSFEPDPLVDEVVDEPATPLSDDAQAIPDDDVIFEPVFASAGPTRSEPVTVTPPLPLSAELDETEFPTGADSEMAVAEKRADTAPVTSVADVSPEPHETPQGLSDADIDRIAKRVVDLAADRLEQIAWDVIPDMAEIIVRERIRELERDFDRTTAGTQTN